MAEVKWIKMYVDMFDKLKIKKLRRLPAGNDILLVWVMLLAMAGKCNANGMIFITENVPFTEEDLADELDFELNTVKLALGAFEDLDMISRENGFIDIIGWEEHQNTDRLSEIREYNRIAKQKSREKKKLLNSVIDKSMTSQRCQETDIEEDQDKRIKNIKESTKEKIDYQQIIDLFNTICKSFPSVRSLSDARKKAIKARLSTYTVDDVKQCFENAEASSFLKGANIRNWSATFDWLIKDQNFAKVLDGNYNDNGSSDMCSSFEGDEFVAAALARGFD